MAYDTVSLTICFLTFWDSVVFHNQVSTTQDETAAVFWNTGNQIPQCSMPSRTDTSSTMLQKLKKLKQTVSIMYTTLWLFSSFIFWNLKFTWQKWYSECELYIGIIWSITLGRQYRPWILKVKSRSQVRKRRNIGLNQPLIRIPFLHFHPNFLFAPFRLSSQKYCS
jgi:hypothetical protein